MCSAPIPHSDPLVYEEQDEAFYTSVESTKDRRYILIHSSSTITSEVRFARVDDPEFQFRVLLPRQRGHEYSVDHIDDRWVIRTNWQARNFRLMTVATGRGASLDEWREFIGHDEAVFIADFELFNRFVAVEERSAGLRKIRDPAVGWRARVLHRLRRAGLSDVTGFERGNGQRRRALSLHLAHDAADHLRLRRAHR